MDADNTGDIASARRLLDAAAKAGDPEAQVNLGYLYARGQGVPPDQKEARNLWRQSAELGHFNAMYNLGISYLQGHGAAIDEAEGTRWMRRAAENGQATAQTWMRQNGYTGPLPRAIDWAAMMVPTVRHAAGHTRVCGSPIS
jgi:TPR repeat protein